MSSAPADSSSFWLRPGLDLAAFLAAAPRLDTALFDIDGVLIDTRRSYRLAVIHASDHLVRVVNGLADAPVPMVSPDDVAAFKLAGGFNSDWDATQLFTSLWTARLREWRGLPEAHVTVAEWAAQASAAARAHRGGITWLRETVPASAIPTYEVARWAQDEFYWGAALVRELYGHEPQYAPDAPGLVHNEELLLEPAVLPALAGLGITQYGLITGRVGPEVSWAVRRIAAVCALPEGEPPYGAPWYDGAHGRSPFGCIVPATIYAKPNPRALTHAVQQLDSHAALYVGDTADDLDLVLRYRHESQREDPRLPPVLAVAVATGEEALTYQARGADLVIPNVRELAAALNALGIRSPGASPDG